MSIRIFFYKLICLQVSIELLFSPLYARDLTGKAIVAKKIDAKKGTIGKNDQIDAYTEDLLNDYAKMIRREKIRRRKNVIVEDILAGASAFIIGFYGYYNDDRSVFAKLIYSATQAGGVYMISDAIFRAYQPSLILKLDYQMSHTEGLSYSDYKEIVMENERRSEYASYTKNAYSGLILAGSYGYNAYREKTNQGLRNVLSFMAFNFLLISVGSFYRMTTVNEVRSKDKIDRKVSINLGIYPSILVQF